VNRLTWIDRGHGWRAGPYEIELAAPELWVCTRRVGHERVKVESTSGSLKALKGTIEMRHIRRQNLRQAIGYVIAFLCSIVFLGFALVSQWAIAPLLVVVFASVGLFAALKAVDCVIRRSWESLRLHYQ
jgi:hypothetical protein